MRAFEGSSQSVTCDGGEQSKVETEKALVRDLKESQTCDYRFYKTLY